ncbi:specifically androgen-regulated gene protein [Diretmus argenteus]
MPKSDTWPGGVAMESLSNMDSAGSCDSVISMNSGFSEDSLEHLSAEERACLMYLEETIEALKVQEDSGLSSDEPDSVQPAAKVTHSSAMGQTRVDDVSSFKHDASGRDQKSFPSYGEPAPAGITEPQTHEVPTEPASKALTIGDEAEQQTLNQASEPQTTVDASDSNPALATNTKDLVMSTDLKTQPEAPVTDFKPPLSVNEVLHSATGADNTCKSVPANTKLCQGHYIEASEMDLGLIPPPSDFSDEPKPHPEPEEEKEPPLSPGTPPRSPLASIDVDGLQRCSVKNDTVSSTVTQDSPSKPPFEAPATPSGALPSPLPEAAEPRSPPAVAPKPKKLPSNIILKSHKASVAGSDANVGHSASATSDRLVMDPQRVRMEALRKLGLLKSAEADSGPALSPKLSPKSRRSWAYPSSPPAAPCIPTPPSTPLFALVSSPPPSLPSSTPSTMAPPVTSIAVTQAPNILPAPDAFSDVIKPPLSHTELSSVSEPTVNVKKQSNMSPLTPAVVAKQSTPPRVIGAKSATLERSVMGLNSYMDSADHSPSQLRNNRPRPASLGSGKDFSSGHGEGSQPGQPTSNDPDTRRPLSASQHSGDSQKLPRSHGVSVLICPRAKNGEDRREALKKLGLIRD